MKQPSKTVVFFGSGPVAARSLELLLAHTPIEAVITKPRPAHHGGSVPVLEVAKKHNLRVHTPKNKRELSELFTKKPVTSTLGVVIDYGIIINQDVIDYFPLGIINSHFSLLPQWRGADPISFAILSGQKQTGVSLMLIDEGMDTGKLLAQVAYTIPENCTTPQLTEDLTKLSDETLQKIIPLWMEGKIFPADQEEVSIAASRTPTYSRKLSKEDGIIDWNKPAGQIEHEIRAFIEWPKSRTKFGEIDVVILSAAVDKQQVNKPGTIHVIDKRLLVTCGKNSLEILQLKPAGKNEMSAEAFLAGYKKHIPTSIQG